MKIEWRTILGASLFLGIICAVYWFWSTEDTGTALLLFGFAAYLMLGGFLVLQWTRRKGIPRAEDKDDGTYEETAGEPLGFFPAASIWPAGLALGAIFAGIALIWGTWYWVISLPLMLGAIIGWSVESEAPEDVPDDLEAAHRSDTTIGPEVIKDTGAAAHP
ncbi:cytochrome c oxidase subunit 4 [Acidiferrimicrobium sp. IK]|uniref:cytochrome c oxidase subunit 4 n=1 Tax=Acidiferrimicrobium sp. IK TaxID=2871700 RepID=UPI0021CB9354|nr:cytochrome c oxidase subunit 4 [Acidiferrimicrobium sp. IK]MCU4186305.1 cytochrome c oxidase subunit 4 [Acidiferrimicrobium sp. IK]